MEKTTTVSCRTEGITKKSINVFLFFSPLSLWNVDTGPHQIRKRKNFVILDFGNQTKKNQLIRKHKVFVKVWLNMSKNQSPFRFAALKPYKNDIYRVSVCICLLCVSYVCSLLADESVYVSHICACIRDILSYFLI